VASEQDAARDRVLAARAALDQEFQGLTASSRAAVDIPAKIRRSPAKAAAIAGGIGFLAVGGPRRVLGRARRLAFGSPAPLPKSLLPEEIEKTLRKMGSDGDKVRGTLERDFADYARQAQRDRRQVMLAVLLPFLRPVAARGARLLSDSILGPPLEGPSIRERVAEAGDRAKSTATTGADSANEQVDRAAGSTATTLEEDRPTAS
jgi:hypothetical protein